MTSTAKQVVKTALQGGIVYTSRGFSILGVFIFWFLAFFRFLLPIAVFPPDRWL